MIVMVLCCSLLFSMYLGVEAHSLSRVKEPSISFAAPFNAMLSSKLSRNGRNELSSLGIGNSNGFSGKLTRVDDDNYRLTGSIMLHDGLHPFVAEGRVYTVKLSNGTTGLIGSMLGMTSDTKEHLNKTIHALPTEDKLFLFVTSGVISENTNIDTLVFGQEFIERSELVTSFGSRFASDVSMASTSVVLSDYNETLRGTGYGAGQLFSGEIVPMSAVTFYTPLRVMPRAKYNTLVKINSHEANALYFTRKYYNFTGFLSTWVSGGTCEIGSNYSFMEVSQLDPPSKSFNVTIPIPWISSGAFGWSPWSISIPLFGISASREKLSGSNFFNIAKWSHNYSRNVDWAHTGPASTAIGYAGQNSIHYLHNPSTQVTVNMYAKGSISYIFQHQIGATIHSGGFTVATPTISAPIIVNP